jgi:hypothetical protein
MALRVRLDRLDDRLVPAAWGERLDLRDRGLGLQAGGQNLSGLARPHQRAGQHEVNDDVDRGKAFDRLCESLLARGCQRPQAIVGILRSALRGNRVTNQVQLDSGHGKGE